MSLARWFIYRCNFNTRGKIAIFLTESTNPTKNFLHLWLHLSWWLQPIISNWLNEKKIMPYWSNPVTPFTSHEIGSRQSMMDTSHGIPRQLGADAMSLQTFKDLAIDNHLGSSCTVPIVASNHFSILVHGRSGSSTDSSIIDHQGGATTPSSTPPVLQTLASL